MLIEETSAADGARLVEHDFQKIRRAAIDARPQMRDRRDELLGVPRPGRNDRAAERHRAAFENPAAGRQVVGEAVDHDLARLDPRGGEGLCRAPGVGGRRIRARRGRRARRTGAGNAPIGAAARPPNGGSAACISASADFRSTGISARSARPAQVADVDVADLAGERVAQSVQFAEPVAQAPRSGRPRSSSSSLLTPASACGACRS